MSECCCYDETMTHTRQCANCGKDTVVLMIGYDRIGQCPIHRLDQPELICGRRPDLCSKCICDGWTARGGYGGACYVLNTTTGEYCDANTKERRIISVEKKTLL